MNAFKYADAFCRNIGWVTQAEQERLRHARVAIGGLGGVGGAHLLTLARLGIGKFSIADFDEFGIVNFNRQVGATMSALARPKVDVMAELVRDINPEIDLRVFAEGITPDTVGAFLDDVDVYVDGLDFFAFGARRLTFAACEKCGIPVVTAAPMGLGASVLVFARGGMPFEDYFGFEGCDETEMAIRLLVGLSPAMLQRGYVADMSRVSLGEQRAPSNVAACQLCAGVAAVETLRLLLDRRGVRLAPWGSQFDAYRLRYVRTWRPWGHRNPLQRLMRTLVKGQLRAAAG
jgi:hypothetical protein